MRGKKSLGPVIRPQAIQESIGDAPVYQQATLPLVDWQVPVWNGKDEDG